MIGKAVITAAGLGTRLLSVTKSQPKEMLPVFAKTKEGSVCMKPIVQLVFEELYEAGFREFCFVVGRGQRTIRDHFTPDSSLLSILDSRKKNGLAKELEAFYEMVEQSRIQWVTQPEPKGFGDAVLRTESFVEDDSFVVHAGDNFFMSNDLDHLKHLLNASQSLKSHAAFLVQEVQDPRSYGVVEVAERSDGLFRISHAIEKPESPASKLAIMPVYVFQTTIFGALRGAGRGYGGELQLTDGIQRLIESGVGVYGIRVNSDAVRLDVGCPDSFLEAQVQSYRRSAESGHSIDHTHPLSSPLPKKV